MQFTAFGPAFQVAASNIETLSNGDLAVLNTGSADYYRFDAYGDLELSTNIASGNATTSQLEALEDGRFIAYGPANYGQGAGTVARVFNADGSPASELLSLSNRPTLGEQTAPGQVTALDGGGFFLGFSDRAYGTNTINLTYPKDINDHTSTTVGEGYDAGFRFFDGTYAGGEFGLTYAGPTSNSGATEASALAFDQFFGSADQLTSGAVAMAYMDRFAYGRPQDNGGGYVVVNAIDVVLLTPDGASSTVRVNPVAYDDRVTFAGGAQVVALPAGGAAPDGGFAVFWEYSLRDDKGFAGYDTMVRYFDNSGAALTGEVKLFHRDAAFGNIDPTLVVEGSGDGRVMVGWLDGVYGVNGSTSTSAKLTVVGELGSGAQTFDITDPNPVQGQAGYISDIAQNADGTVSVAWGEGGPAGDTPLHVQRYVLASDKTGVRSGDAGADLMDGSSKGDWLNGEDGADTLNGAGGGDRLYGAGGDDLLQGGTGDDLLVGGEGVDTASYSASAGAVKVNLSREGGQNTKAAGSDTLVSIENLVGSGGDDRLSGNGAGNALWGGGGQDHLAGGDGADTLNGGRGADVLDGGKGGAEVFVFDAVQDSASGAADTILHWKASDFIDLSGIDASLPSPGDDDFTFGGLLKSGHALETGVVYFSRSGGDTYVAADVSGDGRADFELHLDGSAKLTAGDFIL
jgi:Ca2+-binding RTX toxin-like protein